MPQEAMDVCDRLESFLENPEGIKSEYFCWKMKQQSKNDRLLVKNIINSLYLRRQSY